jgi:hypothetical protein
MLEKLPESIATFVICYLDLKSVSAVARVNKKFFILIKSSRIVWGTNLYFEVFDDIDTID